MLIGVSLNQRKRANLADISHFLLQFERVTYSPIQSILGKQNFTVRHSSLPHTAIATAQQLQLVAAELWLNLEVLTYVETLYNIALPSHYKAENDFSALQWDSGTQIKVLYKLERCKGLIVVLQVKGFYYTSN